MSAAPTRTELLALARRRFLQRQPLDVQSLADALGVSRATAYRWAGNAEALVGEVITGLVSETFERLRREVPGRGARRVLGVMVGGMRAIAAFAPLREFLERDAEAGLRVVASRNFPVQRNTIALHQALLEEEVERGLELPVDTHSMAYALVRVVESFLYADLIAGEEPDVDKAEQILRLMLRLDLERAGARRNKGAT